MIDIIAVVVLGLGVLGGAVLATLHLMRRHVPLWAAFIHGARWALALFSSSTVLRLNMAFEA
jgi:hypothetical protein